MTNFALFHILLFVPGFLLFFFGLDIFRRNLACLSPKGLADILGRMTTTPWRGAVFGAVITAAVQSSSAVTVMTIGLVDAGVLTFPQAVGIILGTNVGTCVTVQLLSLNLQSLMLPCLGLGLLLILLKKRQAGAALAGFGCIFIGLSLITQAASPLAYSPGFLQAVVSVQEHPWAGIALGTLSTAVIQYSSVVMGVLISLSKHNLIGLSASVPLILGINLGTCFTGVLAGIGATRSGQQVAAAHILLNLLGIILVLPALDLFVNLIDFTAAAASMEIANAHTIFNLLSSMAVLPFAEKFARLVKVILPDKNWG